MNVHPAAPRQSIKAYIVHDDVLVRFALTQLLNREEGIVAIGSSAYREGLDKTIRPLSPDVLVIDAESRGELLLDQFRTFAHLRLPIVALTAQGDSVAPHIIPLVEAGAVGFVQKPEGSDRLFVVRDQLVHEIRRCARQAAPTGITAVHAPTKVVAIGSSTGGPEALVEIFQQFPADFPAGVVVVQHMPGQYTGRFVERLNRHCALEVTEAANGERVERGKVIVAKGDYHLVFDPVVERGITHAQARLTLDPPQWRLRPTVDKMMCSLVPIFRSAMTGVILTGMGQDGVIGMHDIKAAGGSTIVQNQETSVVYGMGQEVVKRNLADRVVPLDRIIPELITAVGAV